MKKTIKALILFANPKDTQRLDFAKEKARIKKALESARNKKGLKIIFENSSTIDALRKHLLQGKYNIIHISSHGTAKGIVMENEDGASEVIPFKHLAELLQKHQALECLIFNACHSVMLGMLTSLDIPLTIAMKNALSDDVAIEFSRGFYEAVVEGNDYEFAYLEGCDTANSHFSEAHFEPKILKRGKPLREADLDPEQEYADARVFSNVWFAKKKCQRLSSRNVELGELLIFRDRLEFRTHKSNLSIAGILGVARARMGHDDNNNWVKIVYRNGGSTGRAYIADPSSSEADNSPSGGEELFEILSRRFGFLSSGKNQGVAEDPAASSNAFIFKGKRNVNAVNMTGNVINTGHVKIRLSRKD
ncbi:MAG TPA: CHAT domain-containing protein [Pyrinomonadaceae bacterium]